MAFTTVVVVGQWEREDGSPSQGTVTATLDREIHNDALMIGRVPALGRLNNEGRLVNDAGEPFRLYATNDPDTEPTSAAYQWTLQIDESPVRSFFAPLPHDAPEVEGVPTIDLSELEGE